MQALPGPRGSISWAAAASSRPAGSDSASAGLPVICHLPPLSRHPPDAPLPIQALSSPLSGLLADRLDRTHVVAFGCFLWGVMTAGIGMATTLHQVWP